MPTDDRRDDAVDAYLRGRGWFSRRQHGEQNGYRAGYDMWGWGGEFPGSITLTCLGGGRYEAAWTAASTDEPVLELVTGAESACERAVQLESHTDHIPN